MIEEGTHAPDFTAPSTQGEFRLMQRLDGGPVVLYFYFKADTPG